ncbi:unnamed protein product [Oikopleura dioica]|uniref:Uncharacterized protein n=1 Tax=Oikopleura dioica TaxID=34765 RepID=E4WWV1_OIKDI|nr:unnamed protein product [Oikopleura dioica]
MQRPLVGKLLKINRRDKYAVVQWITPGCELLSDVDYAGPGILYENHAQFDKRMEIEPNSNKVVKYWLKKEAFHIELAEDIYPYVNVYERYFQNLTTLYCLKT